MSFAMPWRIGAVVELKDGTTVQLKSYRLTPPPIQARVIHLGTGEEMLVDLRDVKSEFHPEEE